MEFKVGDRVKLRSKSRIGIEASRSIPRDEVGTVVAILSPPPVGPIYQVKVHFPSDQNLPYIIASEFVAAASE